MKQLPDFDLSIVMPIYRQLSAFKRIFPSKAKYYERNGIEVVIVIGDPNEQEGILDYIRTYPFINWKVVVNLQNSSWQNPAKAFNVGIRQATKQYILIMDPEQIFCMDVIYELRKNLDEYSECYAIDSSYDCLMVKKKYLNLVGGFNERFSCWKWSELNLCKRLELAGIYQLFFPDILLQNKDDRSYESLLHDIPGEVLYEMLLPIHIDAGNGDINELDVVVYDWQEHPYAKEQCREYLSGLKQYDIPTDVVFEKIYPLIALIPTYNESERIIDCLRSVEKYCDGIILLDDDSCDDTYEIAHSEKLLLKARKVRTEFNDKQNRNILLDIASFFKAEWFIFIDADERFDDRFVDLREVMKISNVDIIGVYIANLWNSMDTYRFMKDPYAKNGLWLRWRMFRDKGRMQIVNQRKLHFPSIPYAEKNCNFFEAKTLLLHLGYLSQNKRKYKYDFYQIEDKDRILCYDDILYNDCNIYNVQDISSSMLDKS